MNRLRSCDVPRRRSRCLPLSTALAGDQCLDTIQASVLQWNFWSHISLCWHRIDGSMVLPFARSTETLQCRHSHMVGQEWGDDHWMGCVYHYYHKKQGTALLAIVYITMAVMRLSHCISNETITSRGIIIVSLSLPAGLLSLRHYHYHYHCVVVITSRAIIIVSLSLLAGLLSLRCYHYHYHCVVVITSRAIIIVSLSLPAGLLSLRHYHYYYHCAIVITSRAIIIASLSLPAGLLSLHHFHYQQGYYHCVIIITIIIASLSLPLSLRRYHY